MTESFLLAPLMAFLSAGLAWLFSPIMRRFLEEDSPRVKTLRVPAAGLAAFAGAGAVSISSTIPELVAFGAAGVSCALLVVIDLTVRRLPDVLVVSAVLGLLVPLAWAAVAAGEWPQFGRSLVAAVVLLVGYFLLAFIAPAGVGLGDVKFAAAIGVFLGWFGWSFVALGTLLGFVVNGFVALLVLASRRGGRDTQIPFGPAMVLGAVCAVALLH